MTMFCTGKDRDVASRWLVVALLSAVAAACSDGPTDPGETPHPTEDLMAELAVSPGHLHIWETPASFTVSVVDPDDAPVTDFELVSLERRLDDAADWIALELSLDDGAYVGSHTFESSGDFEVRITGMRPSDDELKVLHELDQPLSVIPAHAELGGYEIAFESFPGHVRAGEASDLTFWFEDEEGETVEGLSPTIFVQEAEGDEETYVATESEPGTYVANHSFESIGPATVGVRFDGAGSEEHEWTVEMTTHAPD